VLQYAVEALKVEHVIVAALRLRRGARLDARSAWSAPARQQTSPRPLARRGIADAGAHRRLCSST
jgi:hypothetical protein